ncbi:hypothetical protein ABPG75_011894 [Micractinium tetrahymenae]
MQAVGQTRPGRLGDADRPPTAAAGAGAGAAAGGSAGGSPAAFIDQTIRGTRVAAFTKVLCPSCRKAKEILGSRLPAGGYAAVDLDSGTVPNGDAVKEELERRTGKHTVPYIFINGQFLGGADELEALESSGQLAARLGA